MSHSAKQVFLESEGDAWNARNIEKLRSRQPENDSIVQSIQKLPGLAPGTRLLEIGCGAGQRLHWFEKQMGFKCMGVEPSAAAVAHARELGIESVQGTADSLPYPSAAFDIVVFGFCLYLCDRGDLFKIATEADRVLKAPGWMIIQDFFSASPMQAPYLHFPGLNSHKMDCRTLFTWHPAYSCIQHSVFNHMDGKYTDDPNEWVALSVLRKVSA
jgi:ubiquinone/menaquinone biosynthesis C-methylase UbiE